MAKLNINLAYLRKLYVGNGEVRYTDKFGTLNEIAMSIDLKKYVLTFLQELIREYPECVEIRKDKNPNGMPVKIYRFNRDVLFEIFRKHPSTKEVILMVTHYDTPSLYSNSITEEVSHLWLGNGEEENG
mgnify:CR=1 FL=1